LLETTRFAAEEEQLGKCAAVARDRREVSPAKRRREKMLVVHRFAK